MIEKQKELHMKTNHRKWIDLGYLIIFMLIGIIGYFTIPTVSNWIIQAGGMGNMSRNINSAANKTGSGVGAVAGAATGNAGGRVGGKLIKSNQ